MLGYKPTSRACTWHTFRVYGRGNETKKKKTLLVHDDVSDRLNEMSGKAPAKHEYTKEERRETVCIYLPGSGGGLRFTEWI